MLCHLACLALNLWAYYSSNIVAGYYSPLSHPHNQLHTHLTGNIANIKVNSFSMIIWYFELITLHDSCHRCSALCQTWWLEWELHTPCHGVGLAGRSPWAWDWERRGQAMRRQLGWGQHSPVGRTVREPQQWVWGCIGLSRAWGSTEAALTPLSTWGWIPEEWAWPVAAGLRLVRIHRLLQISVEFK